MDVAVGMDGRETVRGLIVAQLNYLQLSSLLVEMLGLYGFLRRFVAETKLPACYVMTTDCYDPRAFPLALNPSCRGSTSSLPSATFAVQSYFLATRVMKL